MTNILLHGYYYRYREQRKQIKTLVDATNYTEAKNKLDAIIEEHEAKYTTEFLESKRDFNYGERLILNHVKNHLQTVIGKNDPQFIEDDGITIKRQSDIVKHILVEEQPLSNYPIS